MRLTLDIPDDAIARAVVNGMTDRYEARRLVAEALARLGPDLDALVMEIAAPLVREQAAKAVKEIVTGRARRLAEKGQPLRAAIDAAVRAKVEQLALEVTP